MIAMAILFGIGMIESGNRAATAKENGDWRDQRLIAHAMGAIEGAKYTNSYEAFMSSYDKGYRLFEVDLVLTSDGQLAARHDWKMDFQFGLAEKVGTALTLSQFKGDLILNKYRPLSFADIVGLMHRYPDIYVITDTKETDPEKTSRQFEHMVREANKIDSAILDRIVPEIYTPDMYEAVMRVYPFPRKIYSLYLSNPSSANVISFVKDKDFSAVAMPIYRSLLDPTLVPRLNGMGVKSYVHSVDNRVLMILLKWIGVYGFYTDLEASPARLLEGLKTANEEARIVMLGIGISLVGYGILRMKRRTPRKKIMAKAER
ncbi:phosphatidylinositol-specific phospholipase C/glycerophosphodiester phosphodiesterase family protein [Cohnella endophytica]|nr:phosphatidylinositol-specific phospholipase C/glycerophosphodiester phosphodiesterase family protein [Cohnella endophytica]